MAVAIPSLGSAPTENTPVPSEPPPHSYGELATSVDLGGVSPGSAVTVAVAVVVTISGDVAECRDSQPLITTATPNPATMTRLTHVLVRDLLECPMGEKTPVTNHGSMVTKAPSLAGRFEWMPVIACSPHSREACSECCAEEAARQFTEVESVQAALTEHRYDMVSLAGGFGDCVAEFLSAAQ